MLLDVRLKDAKTEVEVDLKKEIIGNETAWTGYASENKFNEYKIFFLINENNEIKKFFIGNNILEKDIKEQFLAKILDNINRENEQSVSGIDDNEGESESGDELKPYDPELIRVETKPMTISYIYEMMSGQNKDLDISPDFQRNVVWTDISQKSRLIESILLRIPLPVFYFSQDNEGILHVVDGVQRLTVIRDFLNNTFKLKQLEYLTDCEDCYFDKKDAKHLPAKYVRRIKQTQLFCNIIDSQTPYNVKFEIFKRINTGGKPLNQEEIRNCFAKSHVRDLLSNMAQSKEFGLATDHSVRSIRMEDHELIMRFIGFYYQKIRRRENFVYKGKMKIFLDDTLDILNSENPEELNKIFKAFINSMNNAHYLFGEFAFRKCKSEHLMPSARRQLINKSLFAAFSILLSDYPVEEIQKFPEKALIKPLAHLLDTNQYFFDAITFGTNDQKKVDFVFQVAEKLIQENLVMKS